MHINVIGQKNFLNKTNISISQALGVKGDSVLISELHNEN